MSDPFPNLSTPEKLVVIGQGYVGLPISIRAVQVGYQVVGLDVDVSRAQRLVAGKSYVEDVSDEVLRQALASGRFTASASYDAAVGFDYAVITVPTPLTEGLPDLGFIEQSAAAIAPHIRPGATVVLESTTYPGTTDELLVPILEAGSGLKAGVDFYVGYSPERIDPGNAHFSFVNTPKVVSGINAASSARIEAFYSALVDRVVVVSDCKVAELTKLLENTFRHVNIALVNELAMFAHDLDINVWEAIDASSTKPFGFMKFTPGPGVGGHCLPIDPSYLSWRVKRALGQSFRFVELANDVNDHMPDYVIRRLVVALNEQKRSMNGSRILVLGLAYKKNTGDARESPSTRIVELLLGMGCEVRVVDPHVITRHFDSRVTFVDVSPDELAAADAVVLLVDHDAFDYGAIATTTTFILDTRHRMSGATVEYL